MARVNVDDRAHGDPRFRVLGQFLGCPEPYAADFALGRMTRLWRECIERGSYELPVWLVNAILETPSPNSASSEGGPGKTPSGVEGVLKSDLGETGSEGYIRIRGTRGRVEYLERKRAAGRQFGHLGAAHGAKGGRPKKTPDEGLKKPGVGVPENPPPAPAPAPVQKTPLPPATPSDPPTLPSPFRSGLERNRRGGGFNPAGAYREPKGARPTLTPELTERMETYRAKRAELEQEIREKHPTMPDGEVKTLLAAELKRQGVTA